MARPLGRIRTHYYVSPVQTKYENSLPKMIKNSVDEQFIKDLGENCSSPLIWQTTATIIQKYIKELVQHEVDVITDSEWFDEKIKKAIEELK